MGVRNHNTCRCCTRDRQRWSRSQSPEREGRYWSAWHRPRKPHFRSLPPPPLASSSICSSRDSSTSRWRHSTRFPHKKLRSNRSHMLKERRKSRRPSCSCHQSRPIRRQPDSCPPHRQQPGSRPSHRPYYSHRPHRQQSGFRRSHHQRLASRPRSAFHRPRQHFLRRRLDPRAASTCCRPHRRSRGDIARRQENKLARRFSGAGQKCRLR